MPSQRIRREATVGGVDGQDDDGTGFAKVAATLHSLRQWSGPQREILVRVLQDHPFLADYLRAILDPWSSGLNVADLAAALKEAGCTPMSDEQQYKALMYDAYVRMHAALTEVRNVQTLPVPQHPLSDKIVRGLRAWTNRLEKEAGIADVFADKPKKNKRRRAE